MKDICEPLSQIKRVKINSNLYPSIEDRYNRIMQQRISPIWVASVAACLLVILSFELILIEKKTNQEPNELNSLVTKPNNMMYYE